MRKKIWFIFMSIGLFLFLSACDEDVSNTTLLIRTDSPTENITLDITEDVLTTIIGTSELTPEELPTTVITVATEETTIEMQTTAVLTTEITTSVEVTTQVLTTEEPTTVEPTTQVLTTEEPTTVEPTTQEPTTEEPTTQEPTTEEPTTQEPTTEEPTTQVPTTEVPTTEEPTTQEITTQEPTTDVVTTNIITTSQSIPEVSDASSDFYIDIVNDISFDVDLKSQNIEFIEYETYILNPGEDYDFNETSQVINLYGTFLVQLYEENVNEYIFKLLTDAGTETQFSIHFNRPFNRVINGGFETGDLYAWTAYAIWKDEAVMSAFRNERVVSSEFYGTDGSDPYNQDGNYHFGLYTEPYDNNNKDLNQERMGMLRSSNFIIDGSGYISFKLGGGKNYSTAYISIHNADNDLEIARFGNSNFNDTLISQTVNAEGYMFQYYADLSAYIGQDVYILIIDGASHEWSVLAFDSFITYYPEAPTYELHQLAINIVPSIANTGLGLDFIQNGDLTVTLDYWENPNGVFINANGGAVSSNGGNDALGVLRSPAFMITEDKHYLTFDFAGAIKTDKQVFILVKEVGTNFEVLRLVRRDDQWERNDSGDFKSHWYDLSSLPMDKEYYIEVVDNISGEWGVALVRNVELVSADYGSDYQVAVNAYYGLAYLNTENGFNRLLVDNFNQINTSNVYNMVMTLGENPSEEIYLSYHSSVDSTMIELTLLSDSSFEDSQFIEMNGELFASQIVDSDLGFSERYIYQIALENLVPDTEYIFRIHDGFNISKVYSFKTMSLNDSFRFLFITDTQALTFQDAMITKDLIDQAYNYFDDYEFLLNTGDIVETGSSEYYWDLFFQTDMTSLPILSAIGNHDYRDIDTDMVSNQHYNVLFNNPKNGSEAYLNTSYYVIYNNVLFVMLDVVSGDSLEEQQNWFIDVVQNNPADFVIVGTHYSPYGTYHEDSADQMLADWISVFDQTNIDLLLSGHDHMYARTPAIINGQESTDSSLGTVYFIGGTGSFKYRDINESKTDIFDFYLVDMISSISMITVTDSEMIIQSIDVQGNIFDEFTIEVKE